MLWNLLLGLIFLGTVRYGDYITDECPQARYSCPKICDVDHIHLPRKECKNAKSREETFQLYGEGEEGCKEVFKKNGEKGDPQKEVLIEEHINGKNKKSRSGKATI